MNEFEKFGLGQRLIAAIEGMGISVPTEIQEKSIPHVIAGKDLIGESATGSGKTLAFGSGIIEKVEPGQGVQAVVLAPTRELAEQVSATMQKLSVGAGLFVVTIYGGVPIEKQFRDLPKADIVVATPGRLLDHLSRDTVDLSKVRIIVLDEADRMLDMGFIDDVEKIIKACPRDRQTLFFSATIPPRIKDMAKRYMHEPVRVSAEKMVDPSKLTQVYYDVPANNKLSLLAYLLQQERSGLVIVFCNTRRTVDFVVKNLKANRVDAIAIHGGMEQNKRTKTLQKFNDGNVHVLVCTDVAARGLHIENVSHVYNYESPNDARDYVHRVGRTARAGEEGKAINLISDRDYENFDRVVTDYREFNIQKVETPKVPRLASVRADSHSGGGRGGYSRQGGGAGRQQRPKNRNWRR